MIRILQGDIGRNNCGTDQRTNINGIKRYMPGPCKYQGGPVTPDGENSFGLRAPSSARQSYHARPRLFLTEV